MIVHQSLFSMDRGVERNNTMRMVAVTAIEDGAQQKDASHTRLEKPEHPQRPFDDQDDS